MAKWDREREREKRKTSKWRVKLNWYTELRIKHMSLLINFEKPYKLYVFFPSYMKRTSAFTETQKKKTERNWNEKSEQKMHFEQWRIFRASM